MDPELPADEQTIDQPDVGDLVVEDDITVIEDQIETVEEQVEAVVETVVELFQVTAEMWAELNARVSALEAPIVPPEVVPEPVITPPDQPEPVTTEVVHPTGDPEEQIVISHKRRLFRRL